jgi:alanine-glyoxylate transaminase/serine-glyoxylate transaminase/serine-pyruvate transaminase
MATPVIGHLDPQFVAIMDELKGMLRTLFRTKNELTFAVSATGSAGMETCFVNLLERGDEAMVCVNGVFGNRMCDIVERCGAKLIRVDAPWGQPIDPVEVKKALATCRPKLVAIVHAETSTGVLQPLDQIGRLVREAGALFLVDTVTSLGGKDVRTDDWGIDAVYSAPQKCISGPPGLAPVSFSPRAIEVMDKRKTPVQSWYLDLNMLRKYWQGAKRTYHHTAPISMVYGLYEAVRMVLDEGLEARFDRHLLHHEQLRAGLEALGFEFIVEPAYRLPMLNAVRIPAGLEDAPVRMRLLEEFNIEIGAGLGDFAGKVWRIGLMGNSCTQRHVDALLAALRTIMADR